MIGTTVSHYTILSKLGSGGMGVVYEAEDVTLGRHVALKFLPDELAADTDALDRFHREARAASSLNHPNICTIYEIAQDNGRYFIAMELLEGRTLDNQLAGRPLPLNQILDFALQIAEALEAAHARGIVHRDIKSSNVFITQRNQVKVLDFGLAKLAPDAHHQATAGPTVARPEYKTNPGVALGTAAYMSPEQARGEELDVRTDLFSFGAVLYEMATGKVAFKGTTSALVFDQILNRAPMSSAQLNPNLPPDLTRIIDKALEKDREVRYQSASELRADLKRLKRDSDSGRTAITSSSSAHAPAQPASSAAIPIASSKSRTWLIAAVAAVLLVAAAVGAYFFQRAGTHQVSSIAVLPFVNATTSPDNDFLSEGLTEDLISTLSKLPQMRVMARNTVFRFKDKQDEPAQIGQKLKVDAVLVGRISQRGDSLKITADLINSADGSEIWGSQYSRRLADISTLQDEITRDLSSGLRMKLTGEQQKEMARNGTANSDAYALYAKGRHYWALRGLENLQKSIDIFKQAIAADPEYALAYAGLADTYSVAPGYGVMSPSEANRLALEAARKAIELDPQSSESHASLGAALTGIAQWEESEKEFRRALQLNPNNAWAHYLYGFVCLSAQKRFDEALAEVRNGLALDPLSPIVNLNYAVTLMSARRPAEAQAQFLHTLEVAPQFLPIHWKYAEFLVSQGNYAEANKQMKLFYPPYANTSTDRKAVGAAMLVAFRAVIGNYMPKSFVASTYAIAGDREKTFELLTQSVEEGDVQFGELTRYPVFDEYRTDSRFKSLMQRAKIAE